MEYIVVSGVSPKLIILTTGDLYEASRMADKIRGEGGQVTIFAALNL